MLSFSNRLGLAALVTAFALSGAQAQDPRVETPKTPAEFWAAVEFELNTGKYELAAAYLKGFLATNPSEKDLVALEKEKGMAAFLRLRAVQQWSADPKVETESRQLAEQVIEKISAALKKELNDPARIAKFVANLRASAEEREYALRELQRSGGAAMPHLIASLKSETDPIQRALILNVLPRLYADSVPPILAAMDMDDGVLKEQLLQALVERRDLSVLANRAETDPLPTLDYLTTSTKQKEAVRKKAAEVRARIRPISPTRMPLATVELTRAADKLYRHQAQFINPQAMTIWRWQDDTLVPYTATQSQAEEYLGLRYARWALELDPAYEPAQTLFLSLATEKAMERGGLEKPLAEVAPDVHDLLATVYAGALNNTLDRALAEKRTPVALAVTRALGERAEVSAARGERGRPGVLVKALDYPDRRVQLAAAEALLRLPSANVHAAHARIVEVLRRALAADSETALPQKSRILVGAFQQDRARLMADAIRSAGYEVEVVATGLELMRRLKAAGDIDGIVLDSELPYPPLPDTLASLRYDVHLGLLPVRIVYAPAIPGSTYYISQTNRRVEVAVPADAVESQNYQTERRLRYLTEGYRQIGIIRGPLSPSLVTASFAPASTVEQEGGAPTLTPAERKAQSVHAIEWLNRMATGEVQGYDVRPASRSILQALRIDDLAKPAVEATSRLPGAEPQAALSQVVGDISRPVDLRMAAADGIIRHISRHGVTLSAQQGQALLELMPSIKEPELRSRVAAVVGSLKFNIRQAGMRMERYRPPLPKPAATLDPPMAK